MSSLKVNSATPEDFARIFLAVWNSRNAAAMQTMYTPDGVMYDPWAPQGISGDAITAATQRVLDRYPDMLFPLISAVGNESSVAFDFQIGKAFLQRQIASQRGSKLQAATFAGCATVRSSNSAAISTGPIS